MSEALKYLKLVAGIAGLSAIGIGALYLGRKSIGNAIDVQKASSEVKSALQEQINSGKVDATTLLARKKLLMDNIAKAKAVPWPLSADVKWTNFIRIMEAELDQVNKNLKAMGY